MAERLRKDKAKYKGAYTRTKTKLMMTLEGGMYSKMQVMERLDLLSAAFEDVVRAVESLEAHYETVGDSSRLTAVALELEAVEEDFNEIERIVRGYLNSSPSQSGTLSVSRTTPTGQSPIKEQSERLEQEIKMREQEITKVLHDLEKTFAERKKQLEQQSLSTEQQRKEPFQGGESARVQDNVNASVKRSEEQGQNSDPRIQLTTPFQQCASSVSDLNTSTSVNFSGAAAFYPSSSFVHSSTPIVSQPSMSCLPPVGDRPLQQPPLNSRVNSTQTTLVGSSTIRPSAFSSNQLHAPAAQGHSPLQPSSCGSQVQFSTPIAGQPFSSSYDQISIDSMAALKRVSIPRFAGNKKNYEAWKAAFYSCVDQARASPQYKLLRLHECLQGEALKVIENLGYSAAAYEAAKSRLERKYGGKRRALTLRLEELDAFKQIREGNEKDLELFAELLDAVVVNLTDANQEAELGSGSLYISLQRKFNKNLLAKYKQWVCDNHRTEGVKTLREFIDRESEFLTTASETIAGVLSGSKKERALFAKEDFDPKKKHSRKCKVCKESHSLWTCENFKRMTVNERWNIAKEQKLCFRCLSDGHRGEACLRSRVCGIKGCRSHHHRLLHEDPKKEEKAEAANESGAVGANATMEGESSERTHTATTGKGTVPSSEFVALRTVPVYVTNGKRRLKVNALLDDASSKTYLNSDTAAELGLEGRPHELTVNVLNDNQQILDTTVVEFMISSCEGKVSKLASAYTAERVTGNMQVVDWSKYKHKWKHLKGIKFPQVGPRPIVDLLIGVDQADLLYSLRDVRGEPGEPIARLTPLGWTCIGNPEVPAERTQTSFTFFLNDSHELNSLVRRYWDVEEPKETLIVNPEEKFARDTVSRSLTFADGHYSVGMPWKKDRPLLNDNYSMALHRLHCTEKKLKRSPELGEAYKAVVQSYQDKGYIHRVSRDEVKPDQVWYLPHFPVLRPDKSTTKTRIVFDASAKFNDLSLNDIVLQGPKLQSDLFAVLLRFRCDPVALMCDLKEMYLQIKLKPEDQPYHRFLWRNLETDREPDVFEFDRVVFGVNSSPFQAQFVAQEHARKHQSVFPLAAETVLKSTYMDDSMDSVPDVKTAVELYSQLSQLWKSAGMYARKWLSNVPEVLQFIPSSDCASEVDLDRGELPPVKTLGVLWCPMEDVFKFQVNQPAEKHEHSKRSFLKKIATLFDPLGLLSPYTVRAKVLLQEMWASGVDWDEPVNENLSMKASRWFKELSALVNIQIPRCLRTTKAVKEVALHTFVDASQEAYGAVAYTRYLYEDGTVSCRLAASRSRVAPLQAISIPRLELMAAVVGLKLNQAVGQALGIKKEEWTFWSDSMDVLYWIRGQSRKFKPFVANRVGEIQALTNPEQWRHVPTKQNPADLLTRGLSVSALSEEERWWKGPLFLKYDHTQWPPTRTEREKEADVELRQICQAKEQIKEQSFLSLPNEDRLNPQRYSSWTKLTRIAAWVNRFLENCRSPVAVRREDTIQPDEVSSAGVRIIRQAQQEVFKEEVRAVQTGKELPSGSKLQPLKPIIDEDGILRCDGRLRYAEFVPWESRYPIIRPRNHWVTRLIVKHQHEQSHHGGTNQVLSDLSTHYWIISAREVIKEWEKECMQCRRRKASPAKQIMAPLPELRTRMSLRAFSQTSVDFGGPFITKQGRGKARQKRYLCLFTCLATRAVHLEVAFSLDTDSFLNAFFRMVSRRGQPKDVVCDNGTNFVGGSNELKELEALDHKKIQDATTSYGVKWHFNPPLAPHFSGVHEVMIKAAKKAIYAILNSADITDEELVSAVVGAEGLINSRPLTYQSSSPTDLTPLTPNHFLHGQLGGRFAPDSVDTEVFNPRKRWRRVQELVRHFWHRWLHEWIPSLSVRKKWRREQVDLKVGDVVIVMSPDTPRGKWPLGRIVRVFPGRDSKVRVVDVQVGKTVLRRPIVKLCPLEQC